MLTAGQVVARLDPKIQQNALRSAEANLASIQVRLTEVRRAPHLFGWTTRASFDEAQQKLSS